MAQNRTVTGKSLLFALGLSVVLGVAIGLILLEALVRAMDRRDEVFQVIDDSEDVDEAIRRVGQLLGVGAPGSRVVLDLQVRRFTRDQRQAIVSRAEELRSRLPDGR
jgi:DNA gyrase/topoisomerase IV subunit A